MEEYSLSDISLSEMSLSDISFGDISLRDIMEALRGIGDRMQDQKLKTNVERIMKYVKDQDDQFHELSEKHQRTRSTCLLLQNRMKQIQHSLNRMVTLSQVPELQSHFIKEENGADSDANFQLEDLSIIAEITEPSIVEVTSNNKTIPGASEPLAQPSLPQPFSHLYQHSQQMTTMETALTNDSQDKTRTQTNVAEEENVHDEDVRQSWTSVRSRNLEATAKIKPSERIVYSDISSDDEIYITTNEKFKLKEPVLQITSDREEFRQSEAKIQSVVQNKGNTENVNASVYEDISDDNSPTENLVREEVNKNEEAKPHLLRQQWNDLSPNSNTAREGDIVPKRRYFTQVSTLHSEDTQNEHSLIDQDLTPAVSNQERTIDLGTVHNYMTESEEQSTHTSIEDLLLEDLQEARESHTQDATCHASHSNYSVKSITLPEQSTREEFKEESSQDQQESGSERIQTLVKTHFAPRGENTQKVAMTTDTEDAIAGTDQKPSRNTRSKRKMDASLYQTQDKEIEPDRKKHVFSPDDRCLTSLTMPPLPVTKRTRGDNRKRDDQSKSKIESISKIESMSAGEPRDARPRRNRTNPVKFDPSDSVWKSSRTPHRGQTDETVTVDLTRNKSKNRR